MSVTPPQSVSFAHELNNQLAVIAGFAQIAARRLAAQDLDVEVLQHALDEIQCATDHAASVTRRMIAQSDVLD